MNTGFTEKLKSVTPNAEATQRLSFVMLVIICLYLLAVTIIYFVDKKEGMSDILSMQKYVAGGPDIRFAQQRGDAVGSSSFTGSHSPDTPAFWESTSDRVDYNSDAGLTNKTPNAFAETSWSYVEMAVFPNLTSQLKAKYFNSSTAEKLNILTGAAAALGVAVPATLPTGSSVSSMYSPKISKMTNDKVDKFAGKLGGN
jgi:hypothetical protein